jgi:hypothetical protein
MNGPGSPKSDNDLKNFADLLVRAVMVTVSLPISERTVYRLIDRGLLKAHPSFWRQLIFRESMEAFVKQDG